jgi:SprT-like protein
VVELNKFFVENNDPATVLDVLRHELVHYALFMQGKPNADGHPVFERELKRLGIVSQTTINKYAIQSKPINMQVYKCDDCGFEFKRRRALPKNKSYRCSCGGCLSDMGKKLVTV